VDAGGRSTRRLAVRRSGVRIPSGPPNFEIRIASTFRSLEAIRLLSVRLRTPEAELESGIGVQSLSSFIEMVLAEVNVARVSNSPANKQDLKIRIDVSPTGRIGVRLESRTRLDTASLQRVSEQVSRLAPPLISNGPLAFELEIAVWGGFGGRVEQSEVEI
jgi:hypothetical protein